MGGFVYECAPNGTNLDQWLPGAYVTPEAITINTFDSVAVTSALGADIFLEKNVFAPPTLNIVATNQSVASRAAVVLEGQASGPE